MSQAPSLGRQITPASLDFLPRSLKGRDWHWHLSHRCSSDWPAPVLFGVLSIINVTHASKLKPATTAPYVSPVGFLWHGERFIEVPIPCGCRVAGKSMHHASFSQWCYVFSSFGHLSHRTIYTRTGLLCAFSTTVSAPSKVLQQNIGNAQYINTARNQVLTEMIKQEDSSSALVFPLFIKFLDTLNAIHHAQCCSSLQQATSDTLTAIPRDLWGISVSPRDCDFHYWVIIFTRDIILANSEFTWGFQLGLKSQQLWQSEDSTPSQWHSKVAAL